ncbi:MAG: T9SS type A sorting domain-containing protein [Bacteroidota bacterium]
MKKIFLFGMFLLATTVGWSQNVPRKMVCLEIETSTLCTYCPGSAMGADELLENGKFVAVIENHCNGLGTDPYSNVGARSRETLYAAPGYPTSTFDGVSGIVGGSHTQSLYAQFLPKYNTRIAATSPIDISMTFTNNGLHYDVTVTVTKVGTVTGNSLKLFFFVTESNILKNWQGLHWLHFVNRLMVPDKNGTIVDFSSGNIQTYNLSLDMNSAWVIGSCEFIATVQNVDASQGTFNAGGYNVNKREEIQTIKSGLIPLTADFTANDDTVDIFTSVNFSKDVIGGYVNTSQSYQWLFPGATPNSSTDSMPTVTYNESGAHDVTLIVYRGGQYDTLVKQGFIYVTPGVGMEEKSRVDLSVYPNPNHGVFTLDLNTPTAEMANLVIINSKGNIVYRENEIFMNGKFRRNFNLSNLGKGIYFVRLENKTMKGTCKFVVD